MLGLEPAGQLDPVHLTQRDIDNRQVERLLLRDFHRLLRVVDRCADFEPIGRKALNAEHEIELVPTFMGAHEIPIEHRANRRFYIDQLVRQMIPAAARELQDEATGRRIDQAVVDGNLVTGPADRTTAAPPAPSTLLTSI